MDSEINKYICILIFFIIGVFIFYLIKSYCGCKVIVEGQNVEGPNVSYDPRLCIGIDVNTPDGAADRKQIYCDNLNFFKDRTIFPQTDSIMSDLLSFIQQSNTDTSIQSQILLGTAEQGLESIVTSIESEWNGIVPKYICDLTGCNWKPYINVQGGSYTLLITYLISSSDYGNFIEDERIE